MPHPKPLLLNPDFRRDAPKSGPYCARCQRPVDPEKAVAVTVNWDTWEVTKGGSEFVGTDCWKYVAGEEAMTERREDIAELAREIRQIFERRDLGMYEKEMAVAALLRPYVCQDQERIVFLPEEVLSLNDYQLSGSAHPFTCLCGADLVATTRGWICCLCNYTQDWAHTFMKDGSWRKMRAALPSAPLSLESSNQK